MNKTITHGKLRGVLEALGYRPHDLDDAHLVFRDPDRRLFITLPRMAPDDQVRPIDLLRVRQTLTLDGVIDEGDFDNLFTIRKGDRLIRTEPAAGREVRVTAAAGERDGLVVIRQAGEILPCPVDQLRKDEDVASVTR